MKEINFTYRGKVYTGVLVSSKEEEPYYHWFLFQEEELINKVGDSIPFVEQNGKLKPVYTVTRNTDLIETVKTVVAKQLSY